MARPHFALGARQGVFLASARMQKHRKVAAHAPIAGAQQRRRRRPHDHPVALVHLPAQELIAHRAADEVGAHRYRSAAGTENSRSSSKRKAVSVRPHTHPVSNPQARARG